MNGCQPALESKQIDQIHCSTDATKIDHPLSLRSCRAETPMQMDAMAVVKNHNPFAVNDAIFAKVLEYDWHKMNNTGCSLVWGHPQGPTLTRIIIESLEEAVSLGGGYALVFGCAAGDVGIAAIFKVSDGRSKR